MIFNDISRTVATVSVLAAATALAACSRPQEETAGQKIDSASAQTERKAAEVAAEVKSDMKTAGSEMSQAADSMGDKVKDAAITASVKAELARDPGLSALSIDVDTAAGKVALRGTAPDEAARERATSLANTVSGVQGVNNQLVVEPKK
ncbi:MAG: BON domain-containing protein [Chitinophagaceae bacterium]|nr:BON domain-containing protein [Rubrivivax sp.]